MSTVFSSSAYLLIELLGGGCYWIVWGLYVFYLLTPYQDCGLQIFYLIPTKPGIVGCKLHIFPFYGVDSGQCACSPFCRAMGLFPEHGNVKMKETSPIVHLLSTPQNKLLAESHHSLSLGSALKCQEAGSELHFFCLLLKKSQDPASSLNPTALCCLLRATHPPFLCS